MFGDLLKINYLYQLVCFTTYCKMLYHEPKPLNYLEKCPAQIEESEAFWSTFNIKLVFYRTSYIRPQT